MSSLIPQQPKKPLINGKVLQRRSSSFEKIRLSTAYQFKLACSRCSIETQKILFGLMIIRCRVIFQQAMLTLKLSLWCAVQLSEAYGKKLLAIVYTAIFKWQQIDINATTSTDIKGTVQDKTAADGENVKKIPLLQSKTDDRRGASLHFVLAVHFCVMFPLFQTATLLAWLMFHQTPWGVLFLITCIGYISYLLFSIVGHERLKRQLVSSTQRVVIVQSGEKSLYSKDSGFKTPNPLKRHSQIAYFQRNLSKVKLL